MYIPMVYEGMNLNLEVFFQKDPIKTLSHDLIKSEYLGLEKIGDASTHHLRLARKASVTDLWIAEGTPPSLIQCQATQDMQNVMKGFSEEQKKKMPADMDLMKMSRLTVFSNWKLNQPIDAATFEFKPPLGAKLVSEFVTQPPHPLIGKIAPDFELTDLDGKAVKLSSLKGKVVVLDFWATWCGPCVAALPTVSSVTSSFHDKGVVFYAVNMKEKSDVISKFQTDKNLTFPVLLDPEGTVADLYLAKSIPQTVLIDANGKIEAVHVGFKVNLKKELTQQLTDMLSGKDLSFIPTTTEGTTLP